MNSKFFKKRNYNGYLILPIMAVHFFVLQQSKSKKFIPYAHPHSLGLNFAFDKSLVGHILVHQQSMSAFSIPDFVLLSTLLRSPRIKIKEIHSVCPSTCIRIKPFIDKSKQSVRGGESFDRPAWVGGWQCWGRAELLAMGSTTSEGRSWG